MAAAQVTVAAQRENLRKTPKTRSENIAENAGARALTDVIRSLDTLASLITTVQQHQGKFCQQLLREVRSSTPHGNVPESHQVSGFPIGADGSFTKCSTHYGGRPDESLEYFLNAIITYKDCISVSDESALRGFSMLLEGSAAAWWQSVKKSTRTWSEALTRIQSAFGEHDPPYLLYRKLFSLSQEDESTDSFIVKVRALLAKFPKGDLSEKVQLDIAFSLLSPRIRKRVIRECVNNFDELLYECRVIEESLRDTKKGQASIKKSQAQSRKSPVSPSLQRESPVTDVSGSQNAAETAAGAAASKEKEKNPFCAHCKRHNHHKNKYEKLKHINDMPVLCNSDSSKEDEMKCSDCCGAANVIKSKCIDCKCVDSNPNGSASAADVGEPLANPSKEMPTQGLERLTCLETININQKGRGFKGNKYTVHSGGEVLFNLKEDGHALTFLSNGRSRGFHMDGVDNTGSQVFSLRRPGVFVSDKVELYMNKALVSVVRKEATFMTPMFSINDAQDCPTLRVKGEVTDYNFQLQTTTKTTIGHIKKQFRGLLKELFSYNDDYVITFPADLDVRFKLAVIAACVLIDYRYHES